MVAANHNISMDKTLSGKQIHEKMNQYFQNFRTIDQFEARTTDKLFLCSNGSSLRQSGLSEIQYPPLSEYAKITLLQMQPMMMGLVSNSLFLKFGGLDPFISGPHQDCIDKFILLNEIDISKKIT